jgi:hypothetical protein
MYDRESGCLHCDWSIMRIWLSIHLTGGREVLNKSVRGYAGVVLQFEALDGIAMISRK